MSAKSSQQLKQLQSRRDKLEVQADDFKRETAAMQSSNSKVVNQLKSVKAEMEAITSQDPTVTEHAILRYAERAMGLDLEEVRNLILTPKLVEAIGKLGNGTYPIGNGCKAVVKQGTVVSVISS